MEHNWKKDYEIVKSGDPLGILAIKIPEKTVKVEYEYCTRCNQRKNSYFSPEECELRFIDKLF